MEDIPMKVKKLLAGLMAGAVAISALTITASAAWGESTSAFDAADGAADGTIKLVTDDTDPLINVFEGTDVKITDVYGFTFTIACDDFLEANFSGALVTNSKSHGWWQDIEYGSHSGTAKDVIADADGKLTYLGTEPLFAADDPYAHVVIASWYFGGTGDAHVSAFDLLGADGTVIMGDSLAAAPAETTVEETTAAAEEVTEAAAETEEVTEAAPEDGGDEPMEEEVDNEEFIPEDGEEIVLDEGDEEPFVEEEEETEEEVLIETAPEEVEEETTVAEATEAAPAAGDADAASDNPKTGVALALIPAALAGVALIASRKRK
jgi:hypothetical protein